MIPIGLNARFSVYLSRRLGLRRQLQHRRVLTLVQPGEQHDLPVGELQRVVMRVWLLQLDLPESSYLLPNELLAPEDLKKMLALHFPLERALRAGKKTHGHLRFSDGGETTSHADFDSARREAVRTNTLLYTIVIRAMKSESGRNTAGEHALETITDTTGGAVFYPDSSAQLDSIFDRINRELRTQYRLGYYPNPRGPADAYRRIEVTVTPPPPGASQPATGNAADSQSAAQTQPPVYSVRHRKSYYTGLP